jgi:succinate dehydrogenase / fumarate reductase flavoprotein subunit
MKIFPAIHYSMGGIWADYIKDEKTGGMVADHPRNHQTNVPGVYAIGEADYHYHGGNRLGANSLLSCIFTGLFVAPCVENYLKEQKVEAPAKLLDAAAKAEKQGRRRPGQVRWQREPAAVARRAG